MPVTSYLTLDGAIVSESRAGVRKDYLPDPLGSTIALLDDTQTKTDTWSYWPFGEIKTKTGTASTPFQFVGTFGYYEDDSGRTYVRARHYRPALGRWQTVDLLWPGQLPYGYVNSNPTSLTDPTGLACQKPGCTDYSSDPCVFALLKFNEELVGPWDGVTFCCDGKATICVNPGVAPAYRECISKHEEVHRKDLNCKGKPDGWSPPDPCSECVAFGISIRCLFELQFDPKKKFIDAYRRQLLLSHCKYMRENCKLCKKPNPDPAAEAICDYYEVSPW
ncbi:MAG: RHS repeat domain-containing protein [Fimbriimonas sp.]